MGLEMCAQLLRVATALDDIRHFVCSFPLPCRPKRQQREDVMEAIGRKRWAIAEGYIPPSSNGPQPQMTSHESVCLLNTGSQDAHVSITIFYSDQPPVGPYRLVVPAERTKHVRFNNLSDPATIAVDRDYASLIESDQPIVVQHTRLDSRQAENALLSTIAFAGSE
jgi:hypothetical protein